MDDREAIAGYFKRIERLFFQDSDLDFLQKLLSYIYRFQDIEPEILRDLIAETIAPDRA